MLFSSAKTEEFDEIRGFYWSLIDAMGSRTIGWRKGVYPSDGYLRLSLERRELFTLKDGAELLACVILNSSRNEGYKGIHWSLDCRDEEVLVPHALAVAPGHQGRGLGSRLVREILRLARARGKRTVRLDILSGNAPAESLYRSAGFTFAGAETMYYEDTGWTEYKMFELVL